MPILETIVVSNAPLALAGGLGGVVRSFISNKRQPYVWLANIVTGSILAYYLADPVQAAAAHYWAPAGELQGAIALIIGVLGVDAANFILSLWNNNIKAKVSKAVGNGNTKS